jgi:uncharacterized membrane protein
MYTLIDFLPIIAVFIVVIGFMKRWDAIGVVVIAGIVAGLATNFSDFATEKLGLIEVITMLGKYFAQNRIVSIFILTLPVIVLAERYGLKEQASVQIKKLNGLSTGKFLSVYGLIRQIIAAAGIKLGGHVQLTKPLIEPMVQAAELEINDNVTPEDEELLKAAASSVENYGNFFAQNLFVANSGVILIATTLISAGVITTETMGVDEAVLQASAQLQIAKYSIPIAVIAFVLFVIQYMMLDRKLKSSRGGKK